MGTVSVRDRLPRDLAVAIGVADSYVAVRGALRHGLGWDAHAYYLAWPGSLYDVAPGRVDAYNYSPAFAQAIWPLAQLPWPVFCGLFVGAAAVGMAWLLRPLRPAVGIPLWFAFTPEILSGNIYWLLGVVAVLGLRRGWPWVLPALTKVLPTPGPLWFLLRGEWRRLGWFVAPLVVVTAASAATAPDLWWQWVDFLTSHGDDTAAASLAFVPPLWLRLLVALVLLVWGARRNRPWVLSPVMLLATPVVGMGSFALLGALPRLRAMLPDGRPAPSAPSVDEDSRRPDATTHDGGTMTEPSSGVPSEIADSEVQKPGPDSPDRVELDVDEEKLEAWDKVKGDYEVNPGGEPVPNSQEDRVAPGDEDDDDEENVGAPGPS